MERKIGHVVLDDSFYRGIDYYSDGGIENIILDAVRENRNEELLKNSSEWPVLYHLSDIRENLLEWYPFRTDADLLEIGSGCGALTGLFSRKMASVTCIELSEKRSLINAERNKDRDNIKIFLGNFEEIRLEKKFDYITLIGVWEYAGLYVNDQDPYRFMLKKIQKYLKPGGKIFIAIENKMGMKYFNGAAEDHTGKMYSGINDYIGEKAVRTFSKPEILEMLADVGIEDSVFYYPVSDYKLPDVVFSDHILPEAGDIRYYKKDYSACRMYPFYDAAAFDQICRDMVFDYFSNSFLIVCGEQEETVHYAKYNRLRKKEYRIRTSILLHKGDYCVVQSPLQAEASEHINKLSYNEKKWSGILPGIECAHGKLIHESYITPYLYGTNMDVYFYQFRHCADMMLLKIKDIFSKYFYIQDHQKEAFKLTNEFEKIFGKAAPENAYSLPVTNVDLNFSNIKLCRDGRLVNFDFEWIFEFPIPFEYVLWRAAYLLYDKYAVYLMPQISKQDFLVKLGIEKDNIPIYDKMEDHFGSFVYGKNRCEYYTSHYEKNIVVQTMQFK